jgi:ethanolamine utilization cobalamin adenosyltransferase
VVDELEQILQYLRRLLRAEYTGEKLEHLNLLSLSAEQLRQASHRPEEFLGPAVHHAAPDHRQGAVAVRLNTLRTRVRMAELSAARNFVAGGSACVRPDLLEGLNRLSSALYIVYCSEVARAQPRSQS